MKNLLLIIILALSGCATPKQVVSPDVPSLYLDEATDREITRGPNMTIHFPAGEYRPIYRDADGIYYHPDAAIIGRFGFDLRWAVYVKADGSQALDGGQGVPNPLDRPLPFKPFRSLK